jgi:hypothetical protein
MTFAVVVCRETGECCKVDCRFSGVPNGIEMEQYLQEIDIVYKKNKPFYLLYDASEIGLVSPEAVRQQVTFMRSRDTDTKRLVRKCAIIVKSSVVRAILDSLFTIKKPACDLRIFESHVHAKDWLRSKN